MKRFLFIVIALFSALHIAAQDMGADYFAVGEFDAARKIFESRNDNPAETNYYLGEIARLQGDPVGAKNYYARGKAADPQYPLNEIGLLRLSFSCDKEAAADALNDLVKAKQNKKNPLVLTVAATVFYDNGMPSEGDEMLERAETADRNSVLPHMVRGDRFFRENDPGAAAGQYEQALMKNPDYPVAYIRIAQIYMRNNPEIAIERLKELETRHPDYPLTQKYLAKSYFRTGQYKQAIALYEKMFTVPGQETDLDAVTGYAASLFFTEAYDRAAALIQQGLSISPDDFVLNRLRMYCDLAQKKYSDGLSAAGRFFALPRGDNEYIARDYITYGDLLFNGGRPDEAVLQYDMALKLPGVAPETIRQIAENLSRKAPGKAAGYYRKYIDAIGEAAQATDYYTLGQTLYREAVALSQDTVSNDAPERLTQCLNQADSAFTVVCDRIPESYLGPVFRARVNSLRDPEATAGLAKPFYETVLKIILGKEDPTKNRRELVEAYRYLGYYHYVQYEAEKRPEEKTLAVDYCHKILELDPANDVATQLLAALDEQS